jgi:hypothetical protein
MKKWDDLPRCLRPQPLDAEDAEELRAELASAKAQLEVVLDTNKEGTWMARALDAERELKMSNAANNERQAMIETYGRALYELFPDFRASGEPIEHVRKCIEHLVTEVKKLRDAVARPKPGDQVRIRELDGSFLIGKLHMASHNTPEHYYIEVPAPRAGTYLRFVHVNQLESCTCVPGDECGGVGCHCNP